MTQPIMDITTGRIHGNEALARLETRGSSSSLHWFALADEFEVRDELELACLRNALSLLDHRPPGTRLSVNLSGTLLTDPRTRDLLDAQPDLAGLIIEVTENSLLNDTPALQRATSELTAVGVRFAVDDVGSGYSGLRQMTVVRPAYLKLDRSLVSGIDTDPDRCALLSAFAGYAEQTGAQLVAEGVETEQELRTVRRLGIRLVQGFYLARPGPGACPRARSGRSSPRLGPDARAVNRAPDKHARRPRASEREGARRRGGPLGKRLSGRGSGGDLHANEIADEHPGIAGA